MAGYGFGGHIGFAKETSGSTPVAAAYYIEALSESLSLEKERFETINIAGRYSEPDDQTGVNRVAGDIQFAFHPVEGGAFLEGAFDVGSMSEVVSGFLWTHAFKPRTADWDARFAQQPFTFEIFRDVTSSQQYAGCNIGALSFNIAPNQAMNVTASILGIAEANLAKTTASFTGSPNDLMAFDTCSIAIAGAATAQIESLTISLDNQLAGIPTLHNSKDVHKIRRQGFILPRISAQIAFEDITEYEAFKAQTEQRWTVSVTRADSFQLVFDLPRVVYSAFPLGIGGRDRQVLGVEGMCRYHTGSATAIEALLTTTRSFW